MRSKNVADRSLVFLGCASMFNTSTTLSSRLSNFSNFQVAEKYYDVKISLKGMKSNTIKHIDQTKSENLDAESKVYNRTKSNASSRPFHLGAPRIKESYKTAYVNMSILEVPELSSYKTTSELRQNLPKEAASRHVVVSKEAIQEWNSLSATLPKDNEIIYVYNERLNKILKRPFNKKLWEGKKRIFMCSDSCDKWYSASSFKKNIVVNS